MSTENSVSLELDERGVASLTINRPEKHNAFDDLLIQRLLQALEVIEADPAARILLLRAEGESFSAGADLNWMRKMAGYSLDENRRDSMQLATMMHRLYRLNKPTIARVQGPAYGGGVGLIACCDIAIGTPAAGFSLSEVRLGLIPAVISPYVIGAIGKRAASRYFLTAERFNADQAHRLGLLHAVVDPAELDAGVERLIGHLLQGGPAAQAAAKALIDRVDPAAPGAELIADTAERIATLRASEEGREGIRAFLDKRRPAWAEDKA